MQLRTTVFVCVYLRRKNDFRAATTRRGTACSAGTEPRVGDNSTSFWSAERGLQVAGGERSQLAIGVLHHTQAAAAAIGLGGTEDSMWYKE